MSWILAGIGCVFSGLSYAELSSIIPSEGGTYAYAFVALGELPAIITAWCLTLEVSFKDVMVYKVYNGYIRSASSVCEIFSFVGRSSCCCP